MELRLPKPGRYVLAVSGGLDSICLLDLLSKQQNYELIVAHLDHGIRTSSGEDRKFVAKLARAYHLPFVFETAKLGPSAGEATARLVRYEFLEKVRRQAKAEAIITAHHQDDRLETLIVNLIRGTGRVGLSSIGESSTVKRPLLNVPKVELKSYALKQELSWREDSTNTDTSYLRNYIRHLILPRINDNDRRQLLTLMDNQAKANLEIDKLLKKLVTGSTKSQLKLKTLNSLTYLESKELVAAWLRENNLLNFDHKTIERLTIAGKTKRPGSKVDVYNQIQATLDRDNLALNPVER